MCAMRSPGGPWKRTPLGGLMLKWEYRFVNIRGNMMTSRNTDRWWASPPTFVKSMVFLFHRLRGLEFRVLRTVDILFNFDLPFFGFESWERGLTL